MSEQVQLRRGNTSQNAAFTGAAGELVADIQGNVLVLHDGFTVGGHPVPSKAYVDSLVAADTGNVTFTVNTVSTLGTNQNLNLFPNGIGIVHASNLTVNGTIVGSITGSASTVATNANLTGPITSIGNATNIASQTGSGTTFVMNNNPTITLPTLISANIGTPIGNLTYCIFPTLNQNTTGSANNASYLGGLPAVNYAQLLGATFTSLSVTNTIVGNITGSANNASYLGGLPAVNYAQLLGATFTSLSVTNTIIGNITGSANNASYLGNISASGYQLAGTYVTPTTLDNGTLAANVTSLYSIGNISAPTFIGNLIGNTTGSANNASYLGGLPAVNYAQLLGATFTSLSVTNTIVGNINGSANNASYLGNISASGYQTALGFTPYNSTNPAGYITSTTANVISFNGKTGIVNLSSTDVDGALGYTPPSATGAGATGTWGISVTGSAASVTNAAQLAITSVGILTGLTSAGNISAPTFIGNVTGSVTGNVTGNITGSANNASYLGGSPAANYAQLLGATFTSLSVTNTIVGNINGNANNASYLGGSLAANYATLASPVFIGVPVLPSYTFNLLPTVVLGGIIFVSNAVGAHGNGSMCFGNATAWVDVTTGIAVV